MLRDARLTASRHAMSRTSLAALLALSTMVAGCASAPAPDRASAAAPVSQGVAGASAYEYEPGAALDIDRLVLASQETFLQPVGDPANRLPVYPESRLADRLPSTEVCLRLAIGVDGRVHSAHDVTGRPGCEMQAAAEPGFFSAATVAVRDWRFDPAVRCLFASAAEKEAAANTGCATAREIPQAVSLHYRFVFEQKDGQGAVRQVP
jgi:hypothetical protein